MPPAHGRNAHRRRRERKPRYLVVAGGEVTEKRYFEYCGTRYNVDLKYMNQIRSPRQLAEYAVTLKDEDLRDESLDSYKAVWVVVDVDDFHDHGKAQKVCDDNGIGLVISNPCFEVWLIDHVRRCPDGYTSTRDVERYAAEQKVTYGPRNKYIHMELIEGNEDAALRNARSHNTSGRARGRRLLTPGKEREYAPWTDMVDVIKTLRAENAENKTDAHSTKRTGGNGR